MTHLLPLTFFHCSTAPRRPRPRYHGFTIHRVKYTTLGRNTLDERLARRRDLLSDNTQQSQRAGIYAFGGIRANSPSKGRSQTHAFDRVATGIGCIFLYFHYYRFTVRNPTHLSRTSYLHFLYIFRMQAPSRGIVTITSHDYNNVTWSQLLAVATLFVASQFHP